jgi:hypothetical protein
MPVAFTLLLLIAGAVETPLRSHAPAPPEAVNLAPRAKVVASFTAGNALLPSVNDGRLPATPSSLGAWHT